MLNQIKFFKKIEMRVIFICLLFSCFPILSQNGKITVNQSSKLDSIIKLKKELNSKVQNLRIQIFNDTSASIIYETPNYKIWVGNFYNQLEADKKLIEIRKKFRSAFIFRPEFVEIIDDVDESEDKENSESN